MKKIIRVGLVIVGVWMLLWILNNILFAIFFPNDEKNKLNLDSFEINELSTAEIVDVSDDYRAVLTSWSEYGKKSGVQQSKYTKADHDRIKFSAKKITGIKTVSATLARDCKLVINIESQLKNGKAQIVVVQDDTVIEYLDASTQSTLEYNVVGQHCFYVKIICEEAQIEVDTYRQIS